MKEISNLHVALLGYEIQPIKTAFAKYNNTEKITLVVGKGKNLKTNKENEEGAKELVTFFHDNFNIPTDYHMIENPFSKESALEIVDILKEIRNKNKNSKIYLNITGGTNLMAGIALSAALMIGCEEIYYIPKQKKSEEDGLMEVKEEIITIPIPKLILTDAMTDAQKKLLSAIYNKIKKTNKSFKNIQKFAAEYYGTEVNVLQKIHGHLNALEEMNLIKISKDKKEKEIELTESGKLLIRFLQ